MESRRESFGEDIHIFAKRQSSLCASNTMCLHCLVQSTKKAKFAQCTCKVAFLKPSQNFAQVKKIVPLIMLLWERWEAIMTFATKEVPDLQKACKLMINAFCLHFTQDSTLYIPYLWNCTGISLKGSTWNDKVTNCSMPFHTRKASQDQDSPSCNVQILWEAENESVSLNVSRLMRLTDLFPEQTQSKTFWVSQRSGSAYITIASFSSLINSELNSYACDSAAHKQCTLCSIAWMLASIGKGQALWLIATQYKTVSCSYLSMTFMDWC